MSAPFLSEHWYRVAGLKPRLRPHVRLQRHAYRGQPWYVLQDASNGRTHRFSRAAYSVVSGMDGERSVQALWENAARALGEQAPAQDEVVRLLAQLHGADLLQSDVTPDAAEVLTRGGRQARQRWLAALLNPMSVRIPLWDPDRFLDRTVKWVRPLAGFWGAAVWLSVVSVAVFLAAAHWSELTENVAERVLAAHNLLLLWLVFPVVKLAHELGHAYASKLDGGEVHELGVMVLVLSPVPYVDVSSASAFRSKWRRVRVGLAGVAVELFLAAIALFVWLLVEPGLVRSIAYNVMLIAGVSTLVFNLNPLLRFDGYYILADLIETPNLATRSTRYWGYLARRYLLRVKRVEPDPASAGERVWFVAYGPASFGYRIFVSLAIALFVATEYPFVGAILAIWTVIGGVLAPMGKALWAVGSHTRMGGERSRAMLVTGGVLAALALFALTVPLPLRTQTEGVVWLPERAQVRAGAEGFVHRLVTQPGAAVKEGDAIVESRDPTLETEARVLAARLQELDVELAAAMFDDRVRAASLREARDAAQAALARAEERLARLVARAESDGVLVVPQAEDLPGRFFKKGETIAYVKQPEHRIVRAVVPQDDVDLVRHRLTGVEVRLAGRVSRPIPAQVAREVPAGLGELPSRVLSSEGGGILPIDPRDPEGRKTLQRWFQVDLECPEGLSDELLGTRAYVRFEHGGEPVAQQAWRRVRQLFLARFDV